MGSENYGFYFSLLNFSFLFNILLDLGVTVYNNKNISQNQQLVAEQWSKITVLKTLFAILYAAVTLGIGYVIGYDNNQMALLYFLVLNQFIQSFIMYLRSNLAGLHLFKTDAAVSVLDRALMIFICGILLWGNVTNEPFRIEWFVYAQTASYFTAALTALALLSIHSGFIRPRWDPAGFKKIVKSSLPFALMMLLMSFYTRIDSVMLERLLPGGVEQAGVYAQGYRLLEAAAMFSYLAAVLLLPMFARMIKENESVEELTKLSFTLIIIPALIIACGSFYYKNEIMNLLYLEKTEFSAPVFGWLMFGFAAISITFVFGTLLTANGNMRAINIMALSGILVNITLNLILIPSYQAVGAAIAGVATQFATAFIQIAIVQYIFKFKVNYRFIGKLVIFIGIVILSGYISTFISKNWFINLGFMITASASASFLMKLPGIKALVNIMKQEKKV